MKKAFMLALSLSALFSLNARVQTVRSTAQLLQRLSAAPYSVAVFYRKDKSVARNPHERQQITDMQIMMRSISDDPLYKNADLQVLLVDVARSSLLAALPLFHIRTLPTTIVFIGRQPVTERLAGFVDRAQLTQTINQSLDKLMKERMKQKEYQLKQDVEKAKIRSFDQAYMWGSYWAPYWNWGYAPFWGSGWRPYDRWYYW